MLLNPGTGMCLGVQNPQANAYISMELCESANENIHFHMVSEFNVSLSESNLVLEYDLILLPILVLNA